MPSLWDAPKLNKFMNPAPRSSNQVLPTSRKPPLCPWPVTTFLRVGNVTLLSNSLDWFCLFVYFPVVPRV